MNNKQKKTLLHRIEKSDLTNISNRMFDYLSILSKDNYIDIKKEFYFDGFKEIVRSDLLLFSKIYESFKNSTDKEVIDTLNRKADLKDLVDNILCNDIILENFTIYKIQQFINSVIQELSPVTRYDRLSYITENDKLSLRIEDGKYISYKDKKIKLDGYVGYPVPDEISTHLYSLFGLDNIRLDKYKGTLKLKLDSNIVRNLGYTNEINKYLFKIGVDVIDQKTYIYSHPILDDQEIFDFVSSGEVAEKTKKRILIIR